MSRSPDEAAMKEASAVLHRLAAHVEGGTLSADGDSELMAAVAWSGAATALALAADTADALTKRADR